MAINFPNSPEDGDIFSGYIYDATKSVWKKLSDLSSSGIDDLNDVTITSPENGQALIYDTSIEEWINQTLVEPVLTLEGLSDTTIEDPLDGQTLVYDSSLDSWINETPVEPVLTLEGLSDTTIEDPLGGQALVYDSASGQWINETPASNLSDLSDVTISTATTDQLLRWNGTAWVNDTAKTNSIADSAVTASKLATTAGAVMVFDDAAARTTAIPSPIEGMVTYLKDTDKLEKYNGTAFVDAAPGKILQVVSTTKTDVFSSSGTSYTNVTGLSATITPSSTSNKILVLAQISASMSATEGAGAYFRLDGGNSSSYVGDANGSRVQAVLGSFNSETIYAWRVSVLTYPINYLDSPATTSPVTYNVQGRISSGTFHINRSNNDANSAAWARSASSVTLMEIAG